MIEYDNEQRIETYKALAKSQPHCSELVKKTNEHYKSIIQKECSKDRLNLVYQDFFVKSIPTILTSLDIILLISMI